jgi:hypothetical protein
MLAALAGLAVVGGLALLRWGSRLKDARRLIVAIAGRGHGEPSSA